MGVATTVWTSLALPGFHRWPEAAGTHRGYLAERHRHLFHIRVHVGVRHDDRDVEFHDLQDLVRLWWGDGAREWDTTSCEGIARQLWTYLEECRLAPTVVGVSEDGESGATLAEAMA